MSRESEIEVEASMKIISISARYIVASVVVVAIGAVCLVYGALTFLVYGIVGWELALFLGLFLGFAFTIIGLFLTGWGLLWIRREGTRLRRRFKVGPIQKQTRHEP